MVGARQDASEASAASNATRPRHGVAVPEAAADHSCRLRPRRRSFRRAGNIAPAVAAGAAAAIDCDPGLLRGESSKRRAEAKHLRRVIRANPIFQEEALEEVLGHAFEKKHLGHALEKHLGHAFGKRLVRAFEKRLDCAFEKHLGPINCILESLQSQINAPRSHAVEQVKRTDPNNYADECPRSAENQELAAVVEEANQEQTTAVDETNQEQTAVVDGLTLSEAGKGVHLRFLNELEPLVYTEREITAENGAAIKIAIYKDNHVIKSGPLSSARVEIVAIHGDFLDVVPNNWSEDVFNGRVVISKQGPVLEGDCQVKLKNGEACLGHICFKKVSSKTDSGKFILAARVRSSEEAGLRVQEAVMNPVEVQVYRNERNKKSIRPKLKEKAFRFVGISRTGTPFKRLQGKKIDTVEAFLKALNRDEDKLRNECFELKKDSRNWKNIVKHAQECDLEGYPELKSYKSSEENVTLFFNYIDGLVGAKFRGYYRPKDNFDPYQQDLVDRLKKDAYNELDRIKFDHVMEGNCPMPFSANVNIDVSFSTSGTNPSDRPTMSRASQCTAAVKTTHRSQINHPLELPDAFPNIGAGAFQGDQSSGQMATDYLGAGTSGVGCRITHDVPLVMAEGTPPIGNNLPGTTQNAVQQVTADYYPELAGLQFGSSQPANYEYAGLAGCFDPDFSSGNNAFEASTSTRNNLLEHSFSQDQDQHKQRPLNAQSDSPRGSPYPRPDYSNY